ncbi:trypsin-like [Sitophilus oryzae]|uniref:Trypsin-like n=1 Tax=Sitophilus oryzae TaxID=7048 RepID=A0A6J2Y632_SITOR|nr:trypsin-like [Sitophilus oryzae]XP_030758691.1 trypsin-like [Sitophilus oryzae]
MVASNLGHPIHNMTLYEEETINLGGKNEKILHGKVVDITDHPHQIALLNTKFNKIICGGVIVKPRVVFTAAHCTHTRDLQPRKNLAVLAGANHVEDDDGAVHHIAKVFKHPDFSYHGLDSDISVILLKEPIRFSQKARNIEVSTDHHPEGTRAMASGWGRTETGSQSRDLRAVDLTIDDANNCQKHFPGVFHPVITDNMVCVKPHYKSTYYGDSGGPLTVNGKLVGLVSFGRRLKPNKKTTVFTKVGNFLDFMEEVLPEEYRED